MSREVRRVPADWEHPRTEHDGKMVYCPLRDGFSRDLERWDQECAKLEQEGLVSGGLGDRWEPAPAEALAAEYAEWAGQRPEPQDYMPDWPAAERTHYQLYEVTTEGTPLTPPLPTLEDLARYCADHEVSTWGPNSPMDYDHWMALFAGELDIQPVVTIPIARKTRAQGRRSGPRR